jgi:hypothetical protein
VKSLKKAVTFVLTRNCLIAANTGRAFTRRGLKAVAYGWLSSKSHNNDTSQDDEYEFKSTDDARNAIDEIVQKKRGKFSDPNEADSAQSAQAQVSQGYAGRLIFELLQNAADANNDGNASIGYKGIGFRSVLNVTRTPRIHSGELHVRWSQEDAQREIGASGRELPMLEVPCWYGEEETEPDARRLHEDGYPTVIVLPLTESTRSDLFNEWEEVSKDFSLLLFIEGIETLVWREDSKAGDDVAANSE